MTQAMLFAAFGGIAIPLIGLMELQNIPKDRRPDFRDWIYWLPFVIGPILGAALAMVYQQSAMQITPILAVNVGASAPLILRSLAAANPFQSTVKVPPGA